MQQQAAQIDFYSTVEDARLNDLLTETLADINLDAVVNLTLQEVHVPQAVMLTIMITDDNTIRDMNQQYRQQNKPTDVLSFPLLESPLVNAPADQLWQRPDVEPSSPSEATGFVNPPGQATNLGDIAISWPTVLRQAGEGGHSPTYELLYLIVHGILHLVGYDDHTESGYQTMVHFQQSVLAAVGQKA